MKFWQAMFVALTAAATARLLAALDPYPLWVVYLGIVLVCLLLKPLWLALEWFDRRRGQ